VSALERHCELLLRAYPAPYRRRRGAEIRDTLVELSAPGAHWPPRREAVAVVAAGLRRRAGLAADQPAGAAAELVAGWYLPLAVALAASALVLGEWAPWAATPLRAPFGFGPFATDGVPVYGFTILAGLAWWAGRTGLARMSATAAVVAASAMVVFEHHSAVWGRPSLSFVLPVLFCLAPTAVRPPGGERRPRPDDRLLGVMAVTAAAAAPVWLALVDLHLADRSRAGQFWTGRGPEFYRETVASMARWVPAGGAAALVVAVGLAVVARRSLAGGIVVLSAPWLLLAVLVGGAPDRSVGLSGGVFSAVATAAPAAVIVAGGFAALGLWLAVHRSPPARAAAD